MLIFRDINKSLKIDGDPLERITNYDFNVDHSNRQDRKLIYEFGRKMEFDIKQKGRKRHRDKFLIRLLKSPAIMTPGISTIFLPSDPIELRERLKLLLQEK